MDLARQPVIRIPSTLIEQARVFTEKQTEEDDMDNNTKLKRITGKNDARRSATVRPLDNGVNRMAEAELLEQYGCGPIQFSGSPNASYQRHLIFDNVIALRAAGSARAF